MISPRTGYEGNHFVVVELSLTQILAIYGSLLATLNLGWLIYKEITNRSKLKVICYFGEILGDPQLSGIQLSIIKATNVGKQPIYLAQFGGGFEKSHFLIPNQNIPRFLNPGEYQSAYIAASEIFNRDIQFLGAWDSMDRIWKVKQSTIELLKRDYQNILNGKSIR